MCHHCTNRGHWEVSFISILRLLVGFVLLDESILSRNVKFWSSICNLFPGTCLFNQLVKFNIFTTKFPLSSGFVCQRFLPSGFLTPVLIVIQSTDGWYKMLCFSFFEISCLSLEILVGGVGLWQGVFAYISYIYIKIYR